MSSPRVQHLVNPADRPQRLLVRAEHERRREDGLEELGAHPLEQGGDAPPGQLSVETAERPAAPRPVARPLLFQPEQDLRESGREREVSKRTKDGRKSARGDPSVTGDSLQGIRDDRRHGLGERAQHERLEGGQRRGPPPRRTPPPASPEHRPPEPLVDRVLHDRVRDEQ